ncbi:MAG TPA: carboxylating nicotinate-nucleotide diphosphorylase [Tepidiformaceae bacterium]|nr:carboxylating nicotinate-nucleotide diphosphorylase [Tepidiformaceae bacterium]
MTIDPPPSQVVQEIVRLALEEDRARDDITTLATIPAGLPGRATFLAKSHGVVAGLPVAHRVFLTLEPSVHFDQSVADGSLFAPGDTLAVAEGPVRALLQGERTALNFVQRLSGVATLARSYVEAIRGTGAVILDTRKTTPGLRDLEKYAVRCGGATNHRRDLASMAMIKDNHREALTREGVSLVEGVERIRQLAASRGLAVPVELEIDSLSQLDAALSASPDWILLDNMSIEDMREAVRRTAGGAKLEASGGITLETARGAAETGVDAISVGALTHSAPAVDISLELTF